jgi:tRNA (guanine-N7-)-methyltransferase
MTKRRIEREFGVPVAGEVLDPEAWTRTNLKNLPREGRLDWESVFHRKAPVVLDLGCGNGRYLISSAVWRPSYDHLGVDCLPLVIRYASRRANQRGLTNLRFTVADARQLLERWVEPGTVSEVHCYHPQPYFDPARVHLRLLTPEFLAFVHRSVVPGGEFFFQTDNPGYWRYMQQVVPAFFDFEERERTWPDAPKGRTRREIIALRRGLPVFRGSGRARLNLNEVDALRMAASLPPPVFDADRRLLELDDIERLE